MNLLINTVVWFGWLGLWGILEGLGILGEKGILPIPWSTLSRYIWSLEDRFHPWAPYALILGFLILTLHLAVAKLNGGFGFGK